MIKLAAMCILAVCAGFAATFAYIEIAKKYKIVDVQNLRSLHVGTKIRGGGVGIWFASVLVLILAELFYGKIAEQTFTFVIAGTCCMVLGLFDDIFNLSAITRLIVQVVITAGFVLSFSSLELMELCFALAIVVGCINLANFMDGADGLLASQSSVIFFSAALIFFLAGVINESQIAITLGGATLGFLFWNWQPSRVFMGDSGSYFLGFAMGATLIYGFNHKIVLIPVIITMLPLYIDAIVTMCLRIVRGEKIWKAHNQHLYQRFIRTGISHSHTSTMLLVCTLICSALAVVSSYYPAEQAIILVIAVIFVSFAYYVGIRQCRIRPKI